MSGKHRRARTPEERAKRSVPCSHCGVGAGAPCISPKTKHPLSRSHDARKERVRESIKHSCQLVFTVTTSYSDLSQDKQQSVAHQLDSWELREAARGLRLRANWHDGEHRVYAGDKLRRLADVLEGAANNKEKQ